MRVLSGVRSLVSRVRVAPSPVRAEGAYAQKRRPTQIPPGHGAPPPRPVLAPTCSPFVQIEREVLERFRPQLRQAVQDALDAVAAGQTQADTPVCCGQAMHRHDRRPARWLTWVGTVRVTAWRYRCAACAADRRPLLEYLDVEPGQPSGLLARMLGLLGCVASYSLAAEMTGQILGVTVNAMTVWRAVQRLGEAAARYTEALSAYHADSRSEATAPAQAQTAVVVAVDGCMLGMQVRRTRRRRQSADEILPALPPVAASCLVPQAMDGFAGSSWPRSGFPSPSSPLPARFSMTHSLYLRSRQTTHWSYY